MQMYRFMFNACRRPAPVEDITATHPHSNTRVLVIRKNRFFTFDIGEPGSTRSTVEEIEECVLVCIACLCTRARGCGQMRLLPGKGQGMCSLGCVVPPPDNCDASSLQLARKQTLCQSGPSQAPTVTTSLM